MGEGTAKGGKLGSSEEPAGTVGTRLSRLSRKKGVAKDKKAVLSFISIDQLREKLGKRKKRVVGPKKKKTI